MDRYGIKLSQHFTVFSGQFFDPPKNSALISSSKKVAILWSQLLNWQECTAWNRAGRPCAYQKQKINLCDGVLVFTFLLHLYDAFLTLMAWGQQGEELILCFWNKEKTSSTLETAWLPNIYSHFIYELGVWSWALGAALELLLSLCSTAPPAGRAKNWNPWLTTH